MTIIKTKYLGVTNTKGSRIKASMNGFSVTIPYPYQFSHEVCHFQAVKALVAKHDLQIDIEGMGYGNDDDGYYFTFKNSVMQLSEIKQDIESGHKVYSVEADDGYYFTFNNSVMQ